MTSKEFEKMFLDLNSVLVKFWIEQGRPDKEIKIELLERMLNWYKKMGYCTLDAQSASGSSEIPNDLEEAAKEYVTTHLRKKEFPPADAAFIAGAKWQADHTPLPEDTVIYQKGVEEGRRLAEEEQADLFTIVALDAAQRAKEQMMKEAVVVKVGMHGEPINITLDKYVQRAMGIFPGDKVRVIVCKNIVCKNED